MEQGNNYINNLPDNKFINDPVNDDTKMAGGYSPGKYFESEQKDAPVGGYTPGTFLDDPSNDGTDREHPAFKRGEVSGAVTVIKLIKQVIDGTDTSEADIMSPVLNDLRKAVLTYRKALEESTGKASYLSKKAEKSLKQAKELVDKIKV